MTFNRFDDFLPATALLDERARNFTMSLTDELQFTYFARQSGPWSFEFDKAIFT